MSMSNRCQKFQCKCQCFIAIENATKWSKHLCKICNHSIDYHSNKPLTVFNHNDNNLNGYHNNTNHKNLVGLNKKTKHKKTLSDPVSNGVDINGNNKAKAKAKAVKFSNGKKRRHIKLSMNEDRDIMIECKEDRDDCLNTELEIDSALQKEINKINKEFDEIRKKLAQKQCELIGKQVNEWKKWKLLLLDNSMINNNRDNNKNNTMFQPIVLKKQSLVATELNKKLDNCLR